MKYCPLLIPIMPASSTTATSSPATSTFTSTAVAVRISWMGPRRRSRRCISTHLRHGTTSILPTTTVARHEQTLAVLELCRKFKNGSVGNALRGVPEASVSLAESTRPTERQRGRSLQGNTGTRPLTPRVVGAHLTARTSAMRPAAVTPVPCTTNP